MLIGTREGDNREPAALTLHRVNFGAYPMSHGLTRLASRFQADPEDLGRAEARIGEALDADDAERLGLVTFALDDIDWDDEVRVFFEERTSFSPDGLTGMEANLRFVGPETMESKIFARLTAWQNWIFQRPNAVGVTARFAATAWPEGRVRHAARLRGRTAAACIPSRLPQGPDPRPIGACLGSPFVSWERGAVEARKQSREGRTMSAAF
jgi:enoyl-CoA hydratase/carnithine racemase